ncbi:multidrug efflux RND transporter permease subunit [Acinetobacter bereziniae]|uniref:Efflux pump membrane transporter n=1 Tax=Acinetobacter bereziniae TaxID=106648 RepID=A0A8I1DGB7_ACIBZ|nr:multidrug efflux RND transporter permease subunit [Acinetobacter bereziniae]MEC8123415.1 multidrug efflux RND transporter permease subunit [Pseudomonadota bacterium]MBJ8422513.1 multidrug efflux RND transporter permease subunit [Acinetobacter bereziniae]MCU4475548.1 multidrug efflux RND transporter permease subunit [Acinetobacter bereziniae]MCU4542264.1 multidrug efflux RND transporter permease subunit [Acinetobacter bereziniae]MCU4626386.1 multidrug efflux RND transporter permease subunit 
MLSKFFIKRPIFACVLAIIVMALGVFSVLNLPIERYPDIAPPRITVSTTYTGADAETVEESVTQVLEQQIKGIDHLLYFSSSSDSSGRARISISFENGTDPDTAQVQVQNSINGVLNRLPDVVQRQGVTVNKSLGDTFMVVGLYDETGKSNNIELGDYLSTHIEQELSRIEGVGEVDVFGSQYAMRIWLNPNLLRQYQLMPSDIRSAIEAQNTQVAAGGVGDLPVASDQYLNAKVTAGSRLRTVEEFKNIIVKSNTDGSYVYLKDVARVELGAENYQSFNTINGYPSSGMGISLSSGANALATSALIKAELAKISEKLPQGYKIVYPRDNTPFVQESIKEVVKTLFEAIVLVVLVMFIFLQSWRATLIPTITVPIVILGTFAVLFALGMSINTLTLFALVLAIGLLVDDAIVVVENVERLMHEQGLTAKQASIESMQEMTGALIGITVVLTAVFIPMAFFTGSTGVIYRQFSITLVAAMALSLVVALVLTPALCAIILKPNPQPMRWATWFNTKLENLKQRYIKLIQKTLNLKWVILTLFFGLTVVFALFYRALPTSFIPSEDQGMLSVQFRLADGAPMSSSQVVGENIRKYFLEKEKQNVDIVLIRYGRNFSGTGQNLGTGFVALKHWDDRSGSENSAQAIRERAVKYFNKNPNARITVSLPASVNGLGDSDSLEFWIQDVNGQGRKYLDQQFNVLQTQAKQFLTFENLDKKSNPDKSKLKIHIDQKRALANGLSQTAINSTLSAAWGGSYVNDFIDRGRIKRVMMQGDAEFRSKPEDLEVWTVRNAQNQMIPFSNFSTIAWEGGPDVVNRFQGYTALQMEANTAPHTSSGQAMNDIQKLISQQQGIDVAWSGLSFEEQKSSSQAWLLYLISIGFIFLCLAALYESWSIPTAVIAAIPLGIGGNIIFSQLAGFPNDIYFQIALLTTIGLSCKNAILIVEFAALAQEKGKTAVAAALEGAGLRLRPILMTSLAFGAGVIPLVLAFGAGAASRQEIGVSVLGGVIFGTVLVLLFIPFMYVLIRSIFKSKVSTES